MFKEVQIGQICPCNVIYIYTHIYDHVVWYVSICRLTPGHDLYHPTVPPRLQADHLSEFLRGRRKLGIFSLSA